MPRPLFLLLSADGYVRTELGADLERRFGGDFEVAAVATAAAALDVLRAAARVALVIVDEREPDPVGFVVAAHELHPAAKRVLLVARGDWSAQHPAIAAIGLGRFDYHLYRPWRPRERILYSVVSEFLAAWESAGEPELVVFRIAGKPNSVAAHHLRDVLDRVAVPYWYRDAGSAEGRELLRDLGVGADRLPVVVHFDGTVMVQPAYSEIAAKLGMSTRPPIRTCDVAIVGAGPAGLAAAVYAASEGLTTVVLEPVMPGGQAGTSSLIRNYLGFPRGLSGWDLTNRALEQAWLFGANLVVSAAATRLTADGDERVVWTDGGDRLAAGAVVLASGVSWRRLGVAPLEDLLGAGVFYGAAGAEARAVEGGRAYIVGGGNSAGQAALHLARHAATVTLVVRGPGLAASMSEYLITEIDERDNVWVLPHTEVTGGGGRRHLERLELRDRATGTTRTESADALFVMIGGEPRTEWLAGAVDRDAQGYVLTGADVGRPRPLETSVPGVFAAGDVRRGSVKRVASAAGEGAIAVQLVHEYLGRRPDGWSVAPPPRA
jgi:thioredoxin reductase (NADPH)